MRAVRDVQFALRTLTRSPGFTTVVVLTLGLGIGASAAIFTLVNTVLLRPLEYPRPEQLVRITSALRGYGATDTGVATAELMDYQARTDLFAAVAGILPISANVTSGETPTRVEMMLVSWNYFTVLGISPQYGRVFEANDDVPEVADIAVVSDGFWRRSLHADPQAVGRTIVIDGDAVAVVGVMPPSFRHPGRTPQSDVDVWSPSGFRGAGGALTRARRRLDGCLARLQPGVTLEQARGRLVQYGVEVTRQFPADYPLQSGWTPRVTALQESVVSSVSTPMLTLLAAVSLLLLIAFVNVAHLVLARTAGRRREMAIRQALGARTGQLTRQLVTESAVLALAGGALGVVIAAWALGGLMTLAPGRVPRLDTVTFDVTAVLVAIGIACGATAVFGLVPSWQLARGDALGTTDTGSQRTTDRRAGRARHLLVVVEVATATILLIVAGLLVRSIIELVNVPLGFDPDSLLTARMSLPRPNDASLAMYLDPARRVAFVRATLARVAALPGVDGVAMSTQIPMGGFNPPWIVDLEGRDTTGQRAEPVMHNFQVSPNYFDTMRMRIVRGRPFTERDRAGNELVAIVSETAARTYWRGQDPIGKRLRVGLDLPWMTVIGIASDVLNRRLNEPPQPILYRPLEQSSDLSLALLIRVRSGTADLAQHVAREVRAVDADVPLYAVRMMPEVIGGALAQRQFLMRLLVAFGGIAAALALLGIYGVMAYAVSQRTREIGIRMAIGARRADMSRMVIGRGLLLTATGVIAGTAASLALSRFVRSELFAVSPSDPLTIGTVGVLMTLVAAVACYLPARRAASIDPVVALRSE
jgi:predicted permease